MASSSAHGILLESGTNELEILVFSIGQQRYGVNVAKVREVIEPVTVTRLPEAPPSVAGVFQLRDQVIPLVDLAVNLGVERSADAKDGVIIVMEFNSNRVGFRVDAVRYIHRVNVKDVEATPDLPGLRDAPVTFVVQIEDALILMIDFEQIGFDIAGIELVADGSCDVEAIVDRKNCKLLFAEDSRTTRKIILTSMANAGYTNQIPCCNGAEAVERLEQDLAENGSTTIDAVVTDIEMPQMDGLCLTRFIKENPRLRDIPVVILSSLVSPDNEKKCKAVGADLLITKPRIDHVVAAVDKLIAERQSAAAPVPA